MKNIVFLFLLLPFYSCSQEQGMDEPEIPDTATDSQFANVQKVSISGDANNYNFSVTLASPDTGCEQYADWWEVLSEDGKLLYRRILAHSHVNEQPFTRSGGPVNIANDEIVWVRAHMNNNGYGGEVMKGSVATGFTTIAMPDGFANELAKEAPLPSGCAF